MESDPRLLQRGHVGLQAAKLSSQFSNLLVQPGHALRQRVGGADLSVHAFVQNRVVLLRARLVSQTLLDQKIGYAPIPDETYVILAQIPGHGKAASVRPRVARDQDRSKFLQLLQRFRLQTIGELVVSDVPNFQLGQQIVNFGIYFRDPITPHDQRLQTPRHVSDPRCVDASNLVIDQTQYF